MLITQLPYGFLNIEGTGAKALLQGQLTCDLNLITGDISGIGAHCNPKGRVIYTLRILQVAEEHYLLLVNPALREKALQTLEKYARFYRELRIQDLSGTYALFGLDHLAATHMNSELPPSLHAVVSVEKGWLLQVSTQRYLFIVPNNTSAYLAISPNGEANRWYQADLKQGWVTLDNNTSELFTPQQLSLDRLGAVSFMKGCYTGQEIVARLHYLGKVKDQLFYTQEITEPVSGAILYDATHNPVGQIVTTAPPDCLLVCRRTAQEQKDVYYADKKLLDLNAIL